MTATELRSRPCSTDLQRSSTDTSPWAKTRPRGSASSEPTCRLSSDGVRATLNTDGAARHKTGESTGPAGIGAVLCSESGEIIGEMAGGIGRATNNVAEYTALVEGLQMAL